MVTDIEEQQYDTRESPLEGVETCEITYVDGFQGVSVENNVAKVVFFQNIHNPGTKKLTRRARMIMTCPVAVLAQIRDTLNNVVSDMERKGILVIERVDPDKGA
jgi:hypothetical protein